MFSEENKNTQNLLDNVRKIVQKKENEAPFNSKVVLGKDSAKIMALDKKNFIKNRRQKFYSSAPFLGDMEIKEFDMFPSSTRNASIRNCQVLAH